MCHEQDVRLNNRWLDLRVPAHNAIMRIRSGISLLFREALTAKGFVEINTPKLIAGESEGGSEVFRTDYFGKVLHCNLQCRMQILEPRGAGLSHGLYATQD
jgi:aspartyl/asparaginyl-tRNA synthetase